MYEVVYAPRKVKKFENLQDAIIAAREYAINAPTGSVVAVWDSAPLLIAVVSDDANGITVHRLATWPDDVECAY